MKPLDPEEKPDWLGFFKFCVISFMVTALAVRFSIWLDSHTYHQPLPPSPNQVAP